MERQFWKKFSLTGSEGVELKNRRVLEKEGRKEESCSWSLCKLLPGRCRAWLAKSSLDRGLLDDSGLNSSVTIQSQAAQKHDPSHLIKDE